MHRTNYGVFTLVVATLVVRPAAGQNNVKDFSVIIDKPAAEYIVDVGGTMDPENLEITIEGNRLRISGNRPDCCRAQKCSFLIMEISYGPFESVLELPSGYDLGHAKAAYLNGFLRIDVPATQRPPKSTKVPIADGHTTVH